MQKEMKICHIIEFFGENTANSFFLKAKPCSPEWFAHENLQWPLKMYSHKIAWIYIALYYYIKCIAVHLLRVCNEILNYSALLH